MYKKYEKISKKSVLLNKILNFTSLKKDYLSKENTKILINKQKGRKYNVPEKIGLFKEKSQHMPLYSYNGTISHPKDSIIIYLHGGSFIEEAIAFQLKFAMKIAIATNCTLLVPIYPLAPEHTYSDCYCSMFNLYKDILKLNKKTIL